MEVRTIKDDFFNFTSDAQNILLFELYYQLQIFEILDKLIVDNKDFLELPVVFLDFPAIHSVALLALLGLHVFELEVDILAAPCKTLQ